MDTGIPIVDALRKARGDLTRAQQQDELEQRVRATLAPLRVGFFYPAPWRRAEVNGRGMHVVVCAEGHYAAECPTRDAAEAIVLAVNTFAGVAE